MGTRRPQKCLRTERYLLFFLIFQFLDTFWPIGNPLIYPNVANHKKTKLQSKSDSQQASLCLMPVPFPPQFLLAAVFRAPKAPRSEEGRLLDDWKALGMSCMFGEKTHISSPFQSRNARVVNTSDNKYVFRQQT